MRGGRQRTDNSLPSLEVELRRAKPRKVARWHEVLGEKIRFGAPVDRMWISAADAALPLTGYQQWVADALVKRAEEELQSLSDDVSFVDEVRAVLNTDLGARWFKGEVAAEKLGISFRTLARGCAPRARPGRGSSTSSAPGPPRRCC
ncbi:MAG: AraC family transcriptional regulator ligand-binding domain-containing protein, partial [Archangium sp.]